MRGSNGNAQGRWVTGLFCAALAVGALEVRAAQTPAAPPVGEGNAGAAAGEQSALSGAAEDAVRVTILYVGEWKGRLEAYPWVQGSMGGLSRLATAVEDARRAGTRAIAVALGETVETAGPIEELQLQTIAGALASLKFDALGLGRGEWTFGIQGLKEITPGESLPLLCANVRRKGDMKPVFAPGRFVPLAEGKPDRPDKVAIFSIISPLHVEAIAAHESGLEILPPPAALGPQLARQRAKMGLVVVLFQGPKAEAMQLAEAMRGERLDVVIYAGCQDEPPKDPVKVGGTLLVTAGTNGKHLGCLELCIDKDGRVTQAQNRLVPLGLGVPESASVVRLVAGYHRALRERQAMAFGAEAQRYPGGGTYVTNAGCVHCHQEQARKWEASKHALAYGAVQRMNYVDDPDCARCHATGYSYIGGFGGKDRSPAMACVGCEACHGAGSLHVADVHKPYGRPAERDCRTCHDAENSPAFAFGAYAERVRHWQGKVDGRQAAAGSSR